MPSLAGLTIVSYLSATVAHLGLTSSGLTVGVQIIEPYLEDRTPIHMTRIIEEIFGNFTPLPDFD
ncbi:MAG: hypothetical protein GY760_25700 [Deltaproteobacteria bacterium]|nr:hypothetical protein [Deltaproteobacteria bacterium]